MTYAIEERSVMEVGTASCTEEVRWIQDLLDQKLLSTTKGAEEAVNKKL